MDLVEKMHKELIRFMVQKHIFCPITGNVLDMDTCAVVLDADGDPTAVFDPSVGEKIKETPGALQPGYSLMER
jgi:hypothetical protein